MKCLNNSHVSELSRIAMLLASFVFATVSEAALYTTSANTPYAGQSWTDAIWQPGLSAPTPGNTYEILWGGLVQNPSGDTPIFPGDALAVDQGARLRLEGTSPVTLSFPGLNGNAGLILNGGRLQVRGDNMCTIDGQIAVATNSLVDLGWSSVGLVITAQLSGEGNLNFFSWNPTNSMDIQSANNPYSGNWFVTAGYLKGTGGNSLGTGNITVGNGTLEISYDIQTPGTLTLLGSNSVMVLHQDCQFSAVTINGTALEPGIYSYADLAAQFPGNFADGGSGSIAIVLPMQASVAPSAADGTQSNSTSTISNDALAIVPDVPTVIDSIDALVAPLIDTVVPTASSAVTVLVDSSSQITLSWNPSTDSGGSGLAGYRVYRGGVNVGTTTRNSYTDSGLTAGTQYCYTIVAYDNAGNDSSTSAETCATTPGTPALQVFNEWYGPFNSWTNVRAFGAACDGVTDDSVAVSNALAVIGTGHCAPVLLIPGMCRVTKKPWLNQRANVSVVGLNQNTCGFLYDGPTVAANNANNSGAATAFHADAVVNCYFARLKFDGNGKARTVLSSSQSTSSGIFDNNNLYEDCIIKNSAPGGIGVDCGHFGWGFANEDFVRCLIQTNSIGVELENWNALDGWFTDCLIEANTTYGIYVAQGDSHAYHSFFQHNGIDFYHSPGAPFCSMVSNTSYQSGAFFVTQNQGPGNTTPLLFKANTVVDPAGVPYQMNQYGPVFMIDNTTLSTNATIAFNGPSLADVLAVGNTNGVSNWATFAGVLSVRSNFVDNFVVNRSSLKFTLPGQPVAATNLNRTVYEMGVGVTSASLQSAINSAADGSVFHIPSPVSDQYHQVYLSGTVTIPTNKDVRIVGDGADTLLFWEGPTGGTFFSCPFPSHATFSHIGFVGNYGSAGKLIGIGGVGNTPARIYVRDSSAVRPVQANIDLGNCPNTIIDVAGLSFGGGNYSDSPPANYGRNVVLEGEGKVHYINTDGGCNAVSFTCTNGGQLYVENSYNEACNTVSNRVLSVAGNGTITFLGSKMVENIGSPADFSRATGNGFNVANFGGQLNLMGILVIDYLNLNGATAGPVWVEGASTFRDPVSGWPINNSTGDTPTQTMNYNFTDASGTTRLSDIGAPSAAFTRQTLTQARSEYENRTPMSRRANQTDVLLEQVFFSLGTQNLSVTP
jgi:hypothetical protein